MKVFLVSPDERSFLWNAGDRAPLGVLYISAALTKNGIENEVFDLNHCSREDLIARIKKERPEWTGLSVVSSPSFKQMERLAREIKQYTGIVAGGAHVTALPDSLKDLADAVVLGYGERGILRVIEGARGIVKEPVGIDEFPSPDRTKLNPDDYSMWTNSLRTATIVSSRGCPNNCFFCASHVRKIQFRNPENIREEIIELKGQNYGAVYILDENFGVSKKHFDSVTLLLKKEEMKYRTEMVAKDITAEVARRLRDTGCMYVALGIESGDDEILRKANKKTTVEKNREAIEILGKYKIPVKGFFIIGLPGETEETARKTIEFAEEMRSRGLVSADFYALTPFPGSAIWENPGKYGIRILSKDFDTFLQKGEPVIETEHLSRERIKNLVYEARARWQKLEK